METEHLQQNMYEMYHNGYYRFIISGEHNKNTFTRMIQNAFPQNPHAVYTPFTYVHTCTHVHTFFPYNNVTFRNTVKGLGMYTGQTSLSADDNYIRMINPC
jgi:hypothetical protein